MPLNLIIGRSNSGKSCLMYNKIKDIEKHGGKCIVFVPDFARIVAEQEYFKYTNNLGMIDTKITTIKRYSEQKIERAKLYENKEFLPEISKKYIIKKCILDNGDKFSVFSKVRNTPGFADKLYKFVTALETEDLDDDKVKAIISKDDFLSKKFKEIYELYNIVQDTTHDRFVTSLDVLDFFIAQTMDEKNDTINYFFDYYNNFNEKELEYIKVLISKSCSVTITLDLDMRNKDLSDIFDTSYETYKKLINMAKEIGCLVEENILQIENENNSMLEALKSNIFVLGAPKSQSIDNSVQIKLLKNPYEEIEYIAQDIVTYVKKKHYRYSDFKIYYNNSDMYDINIKRMFKQYGIPLYINGECRASADTIIVFLRCLLEQIKTGFSGVNVDNVIQMLKTGLINFKDEDIYLFENYINEFGIKLYNFSTPFSKNNSSKTSQNTVYDLDTINKIRGEVYGFITSLKYSMENAKNTKETAAVLYEFIHSLKILDLYGNQLNEVKNYDVDEFNRKKQIVQSIYDIIDNISIAFDNLDLNTYVDLFQYGIDNMVLKSIPPFIDQVEICNIDSTRSLPRKKVYIIGTYENGLPIISNTESVFSDKEILELEEMGIQIAKTSDIRNNMALFNVYKAVNSCYENLIFTIPSSKLTGESLRMSPIIWRIKDIINVEVDGQVYSKDEVCNLCIDNVYKQFTEDILKLSDDSTNLKKLAAEYSILNKNEKLSNVLNYKKEIDKLKESTVKKLYGKEMLSSISRLERYSACPFNYFTTYILKLKEKKEYRLSALDLGSIMHKVLEDFSKFLLQNNKGFEDITTDANTQKLAKIQIDKSIDDIFEQMYIKYESSARYAYLKTKLKKGMFNILICISKSFVQSEFRPLGFEVEFDNGKLFAPIEVILTTGQKMYLRGKIDRIDVSKIKEATYLRVVDYKSSGKDLKLSDVKDGVSLQLMTYMAALIENKDKIASDTEVLPAAVSYFTLNTDLLNLSECVSEDKISEKLIEKMKMKGIYLNDIEVLKKLDNKFDEPGTSYIDITKRKLSNDNKSLTEERFIEECKNMKEILKKIGNEIVAGRVTPSEKENCCKYCIYSGICGKR